MKLTFIGATHEVTGSCHYVEACGKKFIVDYGMEQGKNFFENVPLPVKEAQLDFVLLTHAHVDHSGMLPLLYKNGFTGKIFATDATADLCEIMLRDCAHIQMQEAEWRKRKGKRNRSIEQVEPVYRMEDAEAAIRSFIPCPYDKEITICEGRNRQIRKMCAAAGLEVRRLTRISEGPIRLGSLPPGKWRELTEEEMTALRELIGYEHKEC